MIVDLSDEELDILHSLIEADLLLVAKAAQKRLRSKPRPRLDDPILVDCESMARDLVALGRRLGMDLPDGPPLPEDRTN